MNVYSYTDAEIGITKSKGQVMGMSMSIAASVPAGMRSEVAESEKLIVSLASGSEEIEQALRLRYRVFVQEEGNHRLMHASGLERDEFDERCDHLIVKSDRTDAVVGTYRLLPGSRTGAGLGFYSETEFELGNAAALRPRILELGRSCVDPAYRDGRVISRLWEGIAGYAQEHGYRYLMGCASIHPQSLVELNEIYSLLIARQVITTRYGIHPLASHAIKGLQWLEVEGREREIIRKLPPLMKGYQWLGAEIGGDPAYDAVFDTVDFLIMLETDKVSRRYKRHFLDA